MRRSAAVVAAVDVEAGEVAAWAADWFHERQLPPEMLLLERALSMCLSIGIGLNWIE